MTRAPSTGQAFVDLLCQEHRGLFVEMLAGSRDGEQAVLFGVRHADGRDLQLEGTLTNLLSEPAVGGWVLTVRDVTERQNLQEELRYQAFHDCADRAGQPPALRRPARRTPCADVRASASPWS